MEAERLGLIMSILTLNGLNFPASCDKGKGVWERSPGVYQMSDELTK